MAPETASNETIYPGMKIAAGATLTATTSGTDVYNVAFNVKATIDTSEWQETTSKLKYTLYSSDTKVESPITADSCQRKEDTSNSRETRISYSGCTVDVGLQMVGTGNVEIDAGTNKDDIVITDDTLTIETGKEKHYYLVVEYVNEVASNQGTTDAGKAMSIQITGVSDTKAELKKAV